MKALLDTHALIWIAEDDDRLGPNARTLAESCRLNELAVSNITLLEIAMLWQKGRISKKLPLDGTLQQVERNFIVLPINATIAADAYTLPLPQADPFDRVITATAKYHKLPLLTRDQHITDSCCIETIW